MTGYGVPPSQHQAQQGRPAARALPIFDLLGAVLGLIVFVFGFLPWYGGSPSDVKGFNAGSAAPAVIGLSILAAVVAAAGLVDKPPKTTFVPFGASIAALLVVFGMLVARGENIDTKWAMIVTLILVLLQVIAFGLAWLQATGKIMNPRPASSAPWGSPQYGYQGGPQSYGQPPRSAPSYSPQQPSYSPPQSQQPPYSPLPPSYSPPQPASPPSYGSSSQPGQAQPAPSQPGQPYQPSPPQQPHQPAPGQNPQGQGQGPSQGQPGSTQPGQPGPGQSQPGQPGYGQPPNPYRQG